MGSVFSNRDNGRMRFCLNDRSKEMKVYIAGPMRGYENYNFTAFDNMRDQLAETGVTPVSPADLDRELVKKTGRTIDQLTPEECMEGDIKAISDCDAIMVLNGWVSSKGCRVEIAYATYRSIPIFYEAEFDLFLAYLSTFEEEKAIA